MFTRPYRKDDLPFGVQQLAVDGRGFPVPWFVDRAADKENGEPDFRIMDGEKLVAALKRKLCWVCGGFLGGDFTFVAGPMCGINRTSSEPPSHHACALFAAKACPFLTTPKAVRNERGLPEGGTAAGIMITRNPGVTMLWRCDEYTVQRVDNGILFKMGEPRHVGWFAEGEPATRKQVMASVETGLPILLEQAAKGGALACFELGQLAERFLRHVPKQRKDPIQ